MTSSSAAIAERSARSTLIRAQAARRQAAARERWARIRPSAAPLYVGEARRLRSAARQWEQDVRWQAGDRPLLPTSRVASV